MLSSRSLLWLRLALGLLAFSPALVLADTPLHERIDQAIAAAQPDFSRRAAGPASDAELLRRIYLDLSGTIPIAAEARAFFKDPSPGQTPGYYRSAVGQPGTCSPSGHGVRRHAHGAAGR